MERPIRPNRILKAPRVGEKASFTRTLTEADSAIFIGVTWDINPLHTDATYVAKTRFGRPIVPGMLTASLLTHLGGLWAFLATEMRFEFQAPVFVGDTITAEAEVVEADSEKRWVRLRGRCTNEHGQRVLSADIMGYPGQFEGN